MVTVRQLQAALANMPVNARVCFPNMEIDQLEDIHQVHLRDTKHPNPDYRWEVTLR